LLLERCIVCLSRGIELAVIFSGRKGQLWTIFNQEKTLTPDTIPPERAGSINDPTHVIVVYIDIEAKGKTLVLFVV